MITYKEEEMFTANEIKSILNREIDSEKVFFKIE